MARPRPCPLPDLEDPLQLYPAVLEFNGSFKLPGQGSRRAQISILSAYTHLIVHNTSSQHFVRGKVNDRTGSDKLPKLDLPHRIHPLVCEIPSEPPLTVSRFQSTFLSLKY